MNYRQHPCMDCSKPCDKRAKRCCKCRGVSQRKPSDEIKTGRRTYEKTRHVETRHPCLDCGKPCTRRSKRCIACHNKLFAHPGQWSNLGHGEHPANWKGGRFINFHGYVLIYKPEHPEANSHHYVLEHRLVWEQYNNPLPKGWVVHHLNGIKHDNRIKNLVALPTKKHRLVLQAKAKRIQELEALLSKQGQLV